jgi:D-3-phosphoglycerate dehydrogenase
MEVLTIGDLLLPPDAFRKAIEREMGDGFGRVREVIWNGESVEDQHHVQQIMEKDGPEAVPTPMEIVKAIGDAEVLTTHFAPIPEAVLEAGPKLKAVIVSRTGVENVNVAAASEHGIAVVNVRGRNASSVAEQASC